MELTELLLPSGKTAFLKKEVSAGDVDDINTVFFQAIGKINIGEDTEQAKKEAAIDPIVMVKMKYMLLERVVKAVKEGDQETKDPDEAYFRNMSPRDVAALEKACDAIFKESNISEDEKKDSSSPTSSASSPETSQA